MHKETKGRAEATEETSFARNPSGAAILTQWRKQLAVLLYYCHCRTLKATDKAFSAHPQWRPA
jgi:hypothetical protein